MGIFGVEDVGRIVPLVRDPPNGTGDIDIASGLNDSDIKTVARIWAMTPKGAVLIDLRCKVNGHSDLWYADSSDSKWRSGLDAEETIAAFRAVDALVRSPICFEKDKSIVSSDRSDYFIEELAGNRYRWAVRIGDRTSEKDYSFISSLVDRLLLTRQITNGGLGTKREERGQAKQPDITP